MSYVSYKGRPSTANVVTPKAPQKLITYPSTGQKLLTYPNKEKETVVSTMPLKNLTPSEYQARREKGLCYHCNEEYTANHCCRNQQFNLIIAKEDDEVEEETLLAERDIEVEQAMDENGISIHGTIGNREKTTIKILGMVKKRSLTILIDSGSTHSFLDCDTAKDLKCELLETTLWLMPVADRGQITYNIKCPRFTWQMQGHQFEAKL